MFDRRNLICIVDSLELSGARCMRPLCHDGVLYTIKGDIVHLHAIAVNLGNHVPLLGDCF
jgi:hypothetical protein